jgi:hypothetical protein
VILRCNGITGSIRGEAEADPITLEQPRPDLVLLDDVQKDATADSPLLCEKMIRLVDGAVTGLAGPGQHIDALMPCTVIREDDVADTYVTPAKKPEWQGRRFQMVYSWPEGINDYEITNESEAGKLWNEYAELRRVSLRDNGHWQPATDLYIANQHVMDAGFVCSWPDRYDSPAIDAIRCKLNKVGKPNEHSAQQHAMNLRLQLGPSFRSEYQNIGRQMVDAAPILITAKQLMAKTVEYTKLHIPANHQYLVSHLDVQDEILFYTTFSCDNDFNGTIIDYGTWPDTNTRFFTKEQTYSWSMLTTAFFKVPLHQKLRAQAIKTNQGKIRAPFEAKIYYALQQATAYLLSKPYLQVGEFPRQMNIQYLGIDTRWGQAADTVKRFIRESGHRQIIPYYGQSFPATNRQLEEYEKRDQWFFEHMKHPHVKEPKWVLRPTSDGTFAMMADVNRLKDFLFQRLATPLGAPGCITLHTAPTDYHELYANHVCSSEYPEPVAARGIIKNQWTVREGAAYDNDYLDTTCGCMALASYAGASIKTTDAVQAVAVRKLSDLAAKKQAGRAQRREAEGRLVYPTNRGA